MRILFHIKDSKEEANKAGNKLEDLGYEIEIKNDRGKYHVYGSATVRDPSFEGFVKKANEQGLGDEYLYMQRNKRLFHKQT